jgi:hypothetical protein
MTPHESCSANSRPAEGGPWSRAWKACSGSPFSRDVSPLAQLSASLDRPLLSVGDREGQHYGHAEGTAGEGDTGFSPASNRRQLDRRVRPVLGDHCLVGKRRRRTAAEPPL